MLLDNTVKIKWMGSAIPNLKAKGYTCNKSGDEIEIKTEDLTKGSRIKVHVKCDGDNCNHVSYVPYKDYLKCLHGEKYYCTACSAILFGNPQKMSDLLNSGQSISFAEWGIQNICPDFVEKYWSSKNKISPYNITYSSNNKIFINCVETDYHGAYKIAPSAFVHGNRCPYCGKRKVHPKDSFGQYLIDMYGKNALEKYWCKENKIDPFKIYKASGTKVILQCQDVLYHHYTTQCFLFIVSKNTPTSKVGDELHPDVDK